MTVEVQSNYLIPKGHPNRCGRKLFAVRALVVHYTANYSQGADDIANARYFARPAEWDNNRWEEKNTDKEFTYASAHYIVDQNSIQLSIPEDEVAYHVGATKYTPFAQQNYTTPKQYTCNDGKVIAAGSCVPNYYTIGIEMCVNQGNDWNMTCELTAELAADIMIRYGLSVDQLIRHYDVTWKECPKPFTDNPKAWQDFKALVLKKINQKNGDGSMEIQIINAKMKVTAGTLNVRNAPNTAGAILGTVSNGTVLHVTGDANGWYRINYNGQEAFVSGQYLERVNVMFNDTIGHWAEEMVEYFGKMSVVKGDEKGNFNPNSPITRAEMITVLYRLLEKKGLL